MPEKLLYRPDEAQTALGISKSTFYSLVRQRLISLKRLNGLTFVSADELKRFADSVPEKAA